MVGRLVSSGERPCQGRGGGQEEEPGKRESKVLGHLVDVSGKNLPEDKKELLTSC